MQTASIRAESFSGSLFLKAVLAASGAAWFVFLILHLQTNLHVFLGRDAFNAYYEELKADPTMLWGVRLMLVGSFIAHVATALVLWKRSAAARPHGYRVKRDVVTSYAARTMRITGPLVGLYVLYHLLHLTVGAAMPAGVVHDPHDYYGNVVGSFSVPAVSLAYIAANLMLAFHLYHGASSMFQSLGLAHPDLDRLRQVLASTLAVVLAVGFAAIPAAVLLGVVGR